MKPIAIFYHCILSGGEPAVATDHMIAIIGEQMRALKESGLEEAAQVIVIGVNGGPHDSLLLLDIAPGKSQVEYNETGTAELPTMKRMQDWCREHPGWLVLYHHTKGAIHPVGSAYHRWRQCMERVVIWNWRKCVADLMTGMESVGAHWLQPEVMPFIGPWAYWGGNFWWATSDFINTLPPIDITLGRYEAEVWIGRGPRRPRVKDYAPHFPTSGC